MSKFVQNNRKMSYYVQHNCFMMYKTYFLPLCSIYNPERANTFLFSARNVCKGLLVNGMIVIAHNPTVLFSLHSVLFSLLSLIITQS